MQSKDQTRIKLHAMHRLILLDCQEKIDARGDLRALMDGHRC